MICESYIVVYLHPLSNYGRQLADHQCFSDRLKGIGISSCPGADKDFERGGGCNQRI